MSEIPDVCIELVEELNDAVETTWDTKYRSPYKFNEIKDIINDFNEKFKKFGCGFKAHFKQKAISTHLSRWTGLRRDFAGDLQYCVPWYGGYVWCVVYEGLPYKEFMKNVEHD